MHSFGTFCKGFFAYGRINSGGNIMMGIGLILIGVLIYFIIKKGSFRNHSEIDSPLDLLQKRFVSGEIDESEYLKKREILEKK